MKPTLIRQNLKLQGLTILRAQYIVRKQEGCYVISYYTGKAWSVYFPTKYKTKIEALEEIKKLCQQEPNKYYNDENIK